MTNFDFIPMYCYNCGNAFPWTESAIAAVEMALEDDISLSSEDKEKALAIMPDIIVETPKTHPASNRMKLILSKAGTVTSDVIIKVLTSIACEAARDILNMK